MMPTEHGNLKPSEAVLRYIENIPTNPQEEIRLPTVREVGRLLGVGPSTVSSVYRTLSNQGRVRTEIGNGSFLLPLCNSKNRNGALQIGIDLEPHDLDDPQGWRSRIYGGLTIAALRTGRKSTLVPLYIDSPDLEQQVRELDALVIMPGILLHHTLITTAINAGIPVVYLNPPHTGDTRNFVSPDYSGASEVLGRAFLTSGRKKVLLLLSDPWPLMISAHYRLSGLLAGLDYGRSDVEFRIEVAHGFEVEDGRKAIDRILEEGKMIPDAIYTSGDFLAMGCVEGLEARGISVPEAVSVVGGSGLNLEKYSHPRLTCCAQPYEAIGAELINMIQRLIDSGEKTIPGEVVPMMWLGGSTTTQSENAILFEQLPLAPFPPRIKANLKTQKTSADNRASSLRSE